MEELEKTKGMGVPAIRQAIDAYYSIIASPEFREAARLRERASHDEAQALENAERRGRIEEKQETARKMLMKGLSMGIVAECTGLTPEELEALR